MTAIIILNYVTWAITLRCIKNIKKTQTGFRYHIYLVDNASPEPMPKEVCEYLAAQREHITFIQAEQNRGYAAGNNLGIRQAMKDGCAYLLIANNDILFRPQAIEKLIKMLRTQKKIGIAGPKVIDQKGRVQISRCSQKTEIKEIFQIFTAAKYIFRKKYRRYYCLDKHSGKAAAVYSVAGCCFAMSAACAAAVTPLDEGTMLYGEEWILGIRMEQAGYETWYCPQSVVIHAHGATAGRMRPIMYTCISSSEIYYCSTYLHAKRWQLCLLRDYRRLLYGIRSLWNRDMRMYWKTFLFETQKWLESK